MFKTDYKITDRITDVRGVAIPEGVSLADEVYHAKTISHESQGPAPARADDPYQLKDYSKAFDIETKEINGFFADISRQRVGASSEEPVIVKLTDHWGWLDEEILGSDYETIVESNGVSVTFECSLVWHNGLINFVKWANEDSSVDANGVR